MALEPGEEYLGDAVYASLQGGMIRLRCEAPSDPGIIWMEEVLSAFMKFIAKTYANSEGSQ